MSARIGLDRCPFCGAYEIDERVSALKTPSGFWYIACLRCGCQTSSYADLDVAMARWNRRTKQ